MFALLNPILGTGFFLCVVCLESVEGQVVSESASNKCDVKIMTEGDDRRGGTRTQRRRYRQTHRLPPSIQILFCHLTKYKTHNRPTFIFLYCNVSTLNPIVGIVWTASSDSFWSRYRMVVFPALSRPRISILTSLDPKRLSKSRLIRIPMAGR